MTELLTGAELATSHQCIDGVANAINQLSASEGVKIRLMMGIGSHLYAVCRHALDNNIPYAQVLEALSPASPEPEWVETARLNFSLDNRTPGQVAAQEAALNRSRPGTTDHRPARRRRAPRAVGRRRVRSAASRGTTVSQGPPIQVVDEHRGCKSAVTKHPTRDRHLSCGKVRQKKFGKVRGVPARAALTRGRLPLRS